MYNSPHVITEKHYLVLCISAFAFGILANKIGGNILSFLLLGGFCALIFTIALIQKPKRSSVILAALLVLFMVFGILRINIADSTKSHRLMDFNGQEAWLCGTVKSEPRLTSNKYYRTFECKIFSINDNISTNDNAIVYLPGSNPCGLVPGDNFYCWAEVKIPEGNSDDIQNDYSLHLKGKNIFLAVYTKNINPLTEAVGPSHSLGIYRLGYFVRSKINYAADSILPNEPIFASILKGILVGDKSGFSDDLYEKFSNSGISHVIAVSGLHLSILYSLLSLCFGVISKNRGIKLLFVLPFVIVFMAAASFTPSICRASIMLIVMLLSAMLSEEYSSVTALFLSLGILLVISPYSLFSKSLVLSFSATFGIFVYFSYINELLNIPLNHLRLYRFKGGKVLTKLCRMGLSSLAISLSTFIGTAYFLVFFFGKISKVQFLTNLWTIPLVFIIFCLGYIICIAFYILPKGIIDILCIPLRLCLYIAKLTVDTFGSSRFSLSFQSEYLSLVHLIIYLGFAYILYMSLKAFHDMGIQRKKSKKLRLIIDTSKIK